MTRKKYTSSRKSFKKTTKSQTVSSKGFELQDSDLIAAIRGHLRVFGSYVTPSWDWNPRHWQLITDYLHKVESGEIKRLGIFTPPRHGKSELVTIHFPAWYLLRNPEKRVITSSYSQDLANTFSLRTREIVREFGPSLFGVSLSDQLARANQWGLQGHHGMYLAAGVGGPITGQGSSLMVIDDPIKNHEEANSPTYRNRLWNWWRSTAYTRLEPDGAVILTLTRWHEDDLAGRLINEMMNEDGEEWVFLNLPAIAERENDLLGRKIGEALWPERFNEKTLARIEKSVGPYVWGALYQTRPTALEGGAIKAKWFKYYTKNEISFNHDEQQWYYRDERLTIYMGVDPAISEKESADDFVIFVIGKTQTQKIILFDVVADHVEWEQQSPLIIGKFQEWGAEVTGIETNAYQKALKNQTIKDAFIPIKELIHTGDKYTRIMTMVPFFSNGQVYIRQALDDEPGFVDNNRLPGIRIHKKFEKFYNQAVTYGPAAAHDDILDALQDCFDCAKVIVIPNEFYE